MYLYTIIMKTSSQIMNRYHLSYITSKKQVGRSSISKIQFVKFNFTRANFANCNYKAAYFDSYVHMCRFFQYKNCQAKERSVAEGGGRYAAPSLDMMYPSSWRKEGRQFVIMYPTGQSGL